MTSNEFSNGEITILWKIERCIPAGICVKTLPQVYNSKKNLG
ncbi:(4Fe-4S)-binding protein [Aequorivita aurantiaca]